MKLCCPKTDAEKTAGSCHKNMYLDKCLGSLVDLAARLLIADIFWKSGMLKLGYYLNNDFDTLIYIFQEEYMLPMPELMAYLSLIGEIAFSAMLAIGLFGRLASVGLLVMVGVIEFTYISNIDHTYWALILAFLIVRGSGKISADYILCKLWKKKCSSKEA